MTEVDQGQPDHASVRGVCFIELMEEGFNDWGRRGYDDFVPGEVTKTPPSGDRTT